MLKNCAKRKLLITGFSFLIFLITLSIPKNEERIKNIDVTYLQGIGGYSKQEKTLIYCVASRLEMSKMKEVIRQVDPKAFFSVVDVHEVYSSRMSKKNL